MVVHHLNCGTLHAPPNPKAACHCLLVEARSSLTLIDTGIGLHDVRDPVGRVGRAAIDAAGFQFDESETAVRQIERLGFRATDVRHVLLTHGDPDHAGGLADFPAATVHVSAEEHAAVRQGDPRYSAAQFAHGPRWQTHSPNAERWFGLEARRVDCGLSEDVLLVPLFGHTVGHCGVAMRQGDRWLLHVGDAYYLRVELATDDHPVSNLAAFRAADNARRIASLHDLRRLARGHADEIDLLGYHDFGEFPTDR